jgi:hypothetical protein
MSFSFVFILRLNLIVKLLLLLVKRRYFYRRFTGKDFLELLLDLCNATSTYCAATFTDCEAKSFFHCDWLN